MSGLNNDSKRKRPQRRKRTEGEKEAIRLKALREEFGGSAIDPDEPVLSPGFPYRAIAYAFKDAQQIHARPNKRFNPKAVVKRVATACLLTDEQKEELHRWLRWLNDRRYVTRDGYQSPVLQWLLSKPAMTSSWPGDADGAWSARVNDEYERRLAAKGGTAGKELKADTAAAPSPPDPATGSMRSDAQRLGAPQKLPRSVDPATELKRRTSHDEPSSKPRAAKTEPTDALRRPALPYGAFQRGEMLANNFFGALRDATDAELIAKATKLSHDADATRIAMARSDDVARCIEFIFDQVGLPLPEANS
ncbi:hypothetical protein ACXYN8_03000 [Altererythrobacter sp. CAU 1778]